MSEHDEWQRLIEMKKIAEYWIARCSRAEKQLEQYKWVSVKDRRPDTTGTYLVYMSNNAQYGTDVYIEPQHTWAFNQASITHWMPFELIPPKSEDDAE